MNERIIITLTTWSARVGNIPAVLDTIFAQTLLPDLVVLNVAYDLDIPSNVQSFLKKHNVEIFRCPDTKVYKKLIPTLKRYPNDCVISIDDDWLYPKGMIEDFFTIHQKYPNFPISGNRVVAYGMQCHCGCASLTKADYFGHYLTEIDEELMNSCPSDDMVYTFLCTKNNHPYIRTINEYHENMQSYSAISSYSSQFVCNGIDQSIKYLNDRFCLSFACSSDYIEDNFLLSIVKSVEENQKIINRHLFEENARNEIKQSLQYRLGSFLLKPYRLFKK